MTDWTSPTTWLVRSAVGGGLILLLTCALMFLIRQPARQQRLGEWGMLAALILAVLNCGPAWLPVDVPFLSENSRNFSNWLCAPSRTQEPSMQPSAGDQFFHLESGETWAALPPGDDWSQETQNQVTGLVEENSTEANRDAAAPGTAIQPGPFSLNRALMLPFSAISADKTISYLLAIYLGCAGILFGRWLMGNFVVFHFLRHAEPPPQPAAQLFASLTSHFRNRPRLLVSHQLRAPVSCGLLHPSVVLPANLCEAGAADRLQWVLAHEITHLERRDSWSCLLFGLGQAVYFYCPWFWWLRRQVRLCQEYIADAAAVRHSEQREDYAQFLVSLAKAPAGPVIAIGVLGNTSDLFRRITMLLKNPFRVENGCPRRWSVGIAFGLLAVAVLASGITLRAADGDGQPPAKAGKDNSSSEKKAPRTIILRAQPDGTVLEEELGLDNSDPEKVDIEALKKALENLPKNDDIEKLKKELLKEVEKLKAARPALKSLIRAQTPQRNWLSTVDAGSNDHRLGIQVSSPSRALQEQLDLGKDHGLVVDQVIPDSPAAKAGFKTNDILVEVNGKTVSSDPGELIKMLDDIKSGTPVEMAVVRKGKKETIKGVALREKQPGERRVIRRADGISIQPPGGLPAGRRWEVLPRGANSIITSVVRTNDRFTTRHQEGNLIITLTGNVADGKAKLSEIHVQDGTQTEKYDSVDKVPERYRDKVKNLVEMSEKGNVKIEINTPRGGSFKDNIKLEKFDFKKGA